MRLGGAIGARVSDVALGRRAIAACARGDDFDRLSGAQIAGSANEGLDPLAEAEGGAAARVAAPEAPGRCQQARTVEPQMALRFGTVDPPQPHPPSEQTGSARAVHQLLAQHRQRIFDLEGFDRPVRGIGHVNVDPVEPILWGARAAAAADGFEIEPEMAVLRVDAGEAPRRA